MGFEPQTSGLPLVNVHKRTTKVNISMAIAVVVFMLVGFGGIWWALDKEKADEAATPPAGSGK